ncbi:uncharacterized protein LOC125672921 [Ostrea edulis]|uniref:uncharacterized protein LOC125672921 n=1 Tax=Ostrea edulis TaxID=37623 RepID=UPI0024AF8849|nr:uncharacterized protein LOC125672921 [Ostrea edulis]
MDAFHTRLRHLAEHCEFDDTEREIKSQIIQGCESSRLRRKTLREPDISLQNILDSARAMEISQLQASGMEEQKDTVNTAKYKPIKHKKQLQVKKSTTCFNCGKAWPHKDHPCPAKDKECHKCKKTGHFVKLCKSEKQKTRPQKEKRHQHSRQRNIWEMDKNKKIKLEKATSKILTYGSTSKLPVKGKFLAEIESKDKTTSAYAYVYVVEGSSGSLLSCATAQELGLMKQCLNVVSHEEILEEFNDRFQGIGKLKNYKVKLHIDETVKPVAQPHRRIPFHIRKKVEQELQNLEDLDIIEKVEGPTPWISPIVAAPKPKDPDKVRICVDMRQANNAIHRERHVMPTVDDMINDLNGVKDLSKLDLNSGYHQLELAPESRYITTFSTHVGLRRHKRLNFGISSAAEAFQVIIQQVIEGIDGVRNLSDDIFVFGNTQEDHDRALRSVLTRLRDKNITLNKRKCEFNGFVFSGNGISADPAKVEATKNAENPTNASEMLSFLGMEDYCVCQQNSITSRAKIFTNGKRSFSYRLELYLFGQEFRLVTDHKPLELIFGNPNSKPPARIERWALRLQPYNFKVVYKPGKSNPSDYMSRHPIHQTEIRSLRASKVAEEYINFTISSDIPKSMKLNKFKTHTDKDPMLRELRSSLESGDWTKFAKSKTSDWKSFYKLRDEFTLADTGIILKNTRILTPKSLIKRVVELAHEGHQGVVKTKSFLREKVWFPGIDKIVESTIKYCIPCQATVETKRIEPLQMSPQPSGPWTEVSMDFCRPFPSGDYLMVVIDEYSRYPVVEILKSISAKSVMTRFDKIFAEFGIPCTLKSDNGPQFNGSEFKQFAEYLGFKHRKITPLWPMANAESERFMRTIEKTIRASNVESKNWKQEIHTFLRNYRATPHCTTKLSPFEILFGRTLKTKLDVEILTERKGEEIETKTDIRKNDEKAKMQMKQYADSKSEAKFERKQSRDRRLCTRKIK